MLRRFLPPHLIGALAFLALVANTAFWLPILLATAAVRLLVPAAPVVRACRRAAEAIATNWIGFNVRGLRLAGDVAWDVAEPPGLRREGRYLVTCNHVSAVDIVIVQWLLHRRLPMIKFFLKRELLWVPGLGIAWWALEFPFMRRYPRHVLERRPELRRRDLETTRRACERLRRRPFLLLNYPEGTRFTEAKRDAQRSTYRHLLLPRAGGIAQVLSSTGDCLDALLDITLYYPAGVPTLWQLLCGGVPRVRVDVQAVRVPPAWAGRDYAADDAFREEVQAFVCDLWARKDARLGEMRGERAVGN